MPGPERTAPGSAATAQARAARPVFAAPAARLVPPSPVEAPPPEPAPFSPGAARIVAWLLTVGQRLATMPDLLEGYVAHLRAEGIPVDRMSLHVRLLHPQFRGLTYLLRADRPGVEVVKRAHGIEMMPDFRTSPIFSIMEEGSEGIRVRIARETAPHPFPVIEELRVDGFSDYAAMPVIYSSGRRNVATFATRAPDGFALDHLTLLYDAMPALTALAEARSLRLLATNLLNTYVGPEAGSRILNGDIRRGTGATIPAVLFYCDLRGFTPLADRLPLDQLIALLNGYFEAMGGPVSRRGGEILKFVGDAMLAIFPVGADAGAERVSAACAIALDAAREAMDGMARLNAQRAVWGQPALGAGIALHTGEVMFGNIGSEDRLDFTVIGPAVNLVTRLEGLTRRLDRPLLTSAGFAAACMTDGLVSLGFQPVKGLKEAVEVFGLRT